MMILLDMKKQILSIVLMLCSVGAMAVSFPTTSHNSYNSPAAGTAYTIGVGTTFVNQANLRAYEGNCTVDKQATNAIEQCEQCCIGEVLMPCFGNGGDDETCGPAYKECINACIGVSLPLDASTLLLITLIAAYGAVGVYRRKRASI